MPIKPNTPKGTRDFSSKQIARRNFIKIILQKSFETFGYEPIETPSFEKIETLTGQYGDEGDRLIFKILNSGEKVKKADITSLEKGDYEKFSRSLSEKALRYDLTVPFARFVSQHQNEIVFPFRRYQIQSVWRADRPQHGRFQEFCQCDADIVGSKSLWQELEMLQLYDNAFNALKIKGVVVRINHRKILSAFVSILDMNDKVIDFTMSLDKIDKIGKEGLIEELRSKGFSETVLKKIKTFIDLSGGIQSKLDYLKILFLTNNEGIEGLNEIQFILNELDKINFKSIKLDFDLSLARGLHYYTGMIVEVSPPKDIKIGSIGGGGRYDNLTESFGLKNVSGIGVSFGFERIYYVMETLDLFPPRIEKHTDVLFLNFGNIIVKTFFLNLNKLRDFEISCELFPTEDKIKKQLSYANQKKIPLIVIIGPEEIIENKFLLKDMVKGNQFSFPIKDLTKILIERTKLII
jgi:histidyl-tRNA synthetase